MQWASLEESEAEREKWGAVEASGGTRGVWGPEGHAKDVSFHSSQRTS